MAKLNRDNQKGFTIVELVVVIIILGILAATALPRFIDVSEMLTCRGRRCRGRFGAGVSSEASVLAAKASPAGLR